MFEAVKVGEDAGNMVGVSCRLAVAAIAVFGENKNEPFLSSEAIETNVKELLKLLDFAGLRGRQCTDGDAGLASSVSSSLAKRYTQGFGL